MARIIVKGIPPYDGDYELDADRAFNAREWRWIKQASGYMPLTLGEGFAGGDPNLFVGLTVVAMCRSGKIQRDDGLSVIETLSEAPWDGDTIQVVADETEDDDLPLASAPTPDEPSQNVSLSSVG